MTEKERDDYIGRPLSYQTLLEFIRQQWELNGKEPNLEIHRDQFIEKFADVGFEFINRFLRDLDERYHAIRVKDYAYSKKWEYEKYMDLTAGEVAVAQGTEPYGKNLDAINRTVLTTSILMEPDFLNVLKSFARPLDEVSDSDSPVESQAVAKLILRGKRLVLEFETDKIQLGEFRSKKNKGYQACKSLLEAQGRMLRKDSLTIGALDTNTNQLPKLMHLNSEISNIFYSYDKGRCALRNKVELSSHQASAVRNFVNRTSREN